MNNSNHSYRKVFCLFFVLFACPIRGKNKQTNKSFQMRTTSKLTNYSRKLYFMFNTPKWINV